MSVYCTDGGFIETRDEQLGSGGRGKVVPVACFYDPSIELSADELVCKVIDPRFRSEGRQQKTALLIEMGKGARGGAGMGAGAGAARGGVAAEVKAAWPLSNLYEDGTWVGYVMPKAKGRSLSEVRADVDVPFLKKVELMRRFCEMIDKLHKSDLVLGDVSLANCLYDASADELTLIDVDSMQVVDAATRTVYPTVESREKSPEMLAGTLGDVVLSSRSDDYLVAVEVFRVLFGAHPLDEYRKDVSPAKVRAENARNRRFAYELNGEGCGVSVFGKRLAELFRRSFAGEYESIPSARAYAEALLELESPRKADLLDVRKLGRAGAVAAVVCGICLFVPEIASATPGLVVEAQEWAEKVSAWAAEASAWTHDGEGLLTEARALVDEAGVWVDQLAAEASAEFEAAQLAFGEAKTWALGLWDLACEKGSALCAWISEAADAVWAYFE